MSDLEQKPSRTLWVSAAVIALVLHVGGAALALTNLHGEEPEDVSGVSAIEVGVELAAPNREVTDLPAGPDADASVASPQVNEQKAEVKETDLPKDTPNEIEDADRVVTENDNKKPTEEEQKVAAVQTAASQESVAAEATAMPTVEAAPEAPRSVAPVIGNGNALRRARETWQKRLMAHLDKHKKYPAGGALKSAEIYVSFTLDRLGHVLDMAIEKGSGDAAFDQAALAMIKRSDPVPAPPPLVADEGLKFTLPVVFRVKGKG
ncbi:MULTISPECIES: energy transducer TonB [unclassified Bradyrhizobium]|uniref:energy transducer TonB n=1 Tax=unclassified Bradyrhizobium TaxID=2631580 RepID=UPI0024795C51|nr:MULTISPECIES: energy transducer TonB [unclassified Bradyrhizobium]WGR92503.1 energy transducer TonB [Bradyrhizobium sp. ISRA435]WGR96896.1 energy transducer TonB [Bradyrhizobium sp. ISRA436]WGS03783.1 energy transducer TonB [Bradyrhizobium sp. ISRA437]WGS10667.1 energy transducer TonB [Bradyrhizobium sp. ISRA443]WGS17933.1 energy transducer TonB [Bradyrhizobium sp. ISRA463]